MRLAAVLFFALSPLAATAATPTTPSPAPDARLQGAYKFHQDGWTHVHLQGTPEQIGFQYGYLLARQIEDNVHVYAVEAVHLDKRPW
ncbi:MAG: hypothetical protein ACP5E5_10810 [Acidobacteriaceae bacterium]